MYKLYCIRFWDYKLGTSIAHNTLTITSASYATKLSANTNTNFEISNLATYVKIILLERCVQWLVQLYNLTIPKLFEYVSFVAE